MRMGKLIRGLCILIGPAKRPFAGTIRRFREWNTRRKTRKNLKRILGDLADNPDIPRPAREALRSGAVSKDALRQVESIVLVFLGRREEILEILRQDKLVRFLKLLDEHPRDTSAPTTAGTQRPPRELPPPS